MFRHIVFLPLLLIACTPRLIGGMPLSPPGAPANSVDQACLLVDNSVALDEPFPTTYEAAAVLLTCSSKQANVVTHYSGRRSAVSSRVLCDNTPLMSYDEQADRVSLSAAGKAAFCDGGLCVLYDASGAQVLLSALISESTLPTLQAGQGSPVPFLRTTLRFGFNGLLQTFASRMLSAFAQNVNGEIDLRAIAFLGTSQSTCSFPLAPCVCPS